SHGMEFASPIVAAIRCAVENQNHLASSSSPRTASAIAKIRPGNSSGPSVRCYAAHRLTRVSAGDAMRRRQFITGLGIATLSPVIVRAQQPAMPVIGYLSGWSPGDAPIYLAYFKQGLVEAGYSEGRNVAIEYRYAEGRFDRLPELVA